MKAKKQIFYSSLCSFLLLPAIFFAQVKENLFDLPNYGRIVLIGDGLVERMNEHGHFETLLQAANRSNRLVIRNLGWSGDELELNFRRPDYGDTNSYLNEIKPDLILAFVGGNDSYHQESGMKAFENKLETFVDRLQKIETRNSEPPKIILISPIAHEKINRLPFEVVEANNWIEKYTAIIKSVADSYDLSFVDLYQPTKEKFEQSEEEFTINSIHLSSKGYEMLSEILEEKLKLKKYNYKKEAAEALRKMINKKNKEFFFYWRPVNAEYIVGVRKEPFGVITFPPEIEKIRMLVEKWDQQIWDLK